MSSGTPENAYELSNAGQQQAAVLVASELGVQMTAVQPLGSAVPVANATGLDVVVVIGSDLAGSGFPATTAPTTTVPTT